MSLKELLFLILFLLISSCQKDANLNLRDYESHLVANCFLTPDSALSVDLSESVRSDLKPDFKPVTGARVIISDQRSEFLLAETGKGRYIHPFRPIPGESYSLEIVPAEGKGLFASTTIPSSPEIKVHSIPADSIVQLTIKDKPGERNIYWVGLQFYDWNRQSLYNMPYISSNLILFDDFNRVRGEDMSGLMQYSYHFYARLEDTAFRGGEVTFELSYLWPDWDPGSDTDRSYAYVISADEHFDRYMKSALIQYELGVISDLPVFHTPINIYSNIENGRGIFGSYTLSLHEITIQ